ncbi:MAG TPA: hypothetical protein PLW81_00280 [Thiobacillaceae bacterium]|nr:hypothetical protein [Thiobacillaceae bacterium]
MKYRVSVNYQPITDQQIKEITEVVGHEANGMALMRLQLDEAAEEFIVGHHWQSFSSPSGLVKLLTRISKAAQKLSDRLSSGDKRATDAARRLVAALVATQDSFELESILNVGIGGKREDRLGPLVDDLRHADADRLATLMPAIEMLRKVAEGAASRLATQKNHGRDRHQKNHAVVTLLEELRRIYMEHFGRIGIASDYGAGGPFIRFVEGVLDAISRNLSSEIVESDPQITNTLGMTGNAIRQAVRRIEDNQAELDASAILEASITYLAGMSVEAIKKLLTKK